MFILTNVTDQMSVLLALICTCWMNSGQMQEMKIIITKLLDEKKTSWVKEMQFKKTSLAIKWLSPMPWSYLMYCMCEDIFKYLNGLYCQLHKGFWRMERSNRKYNRKYRHELHALNTAAPIWGEVLDLLLTLCLVSILTDASSFSVIVHNCCLLSPKGLR